MDGYSVYINVDDEGNITEGLVGQRVIPNKQYDIFFYLNHYINVSNFKIKYDGRKAILMEKETKQAE